MYPVRELPFVRILIILFTLGVTACGGSGGGTSTPTTPTSINLWTWMSGSDTVMQNGSYGTQGTADPTNVPGARQRSVSWIDSSDNLWLFGGLGYDSLGTSGRLNDLWKYDGTNWTWVSGSNTVNQAGTYGTRGTADPANVPGARNYSVSWIDGSGNLWLFGGIGRDSAGTTSSLNDLWRFDGTNWTWISGSNTVNQQGTYGTQGTADPANVPGARIAAVSWIDSSGNLWLFGGSGLDSAGTVGDLNDLWKFDGTNWTWVSGSNTVNQAGTYGTQGTADPANVPGARGYALSWIDSSDNLWLFGGYDSVGSPGDLNDLWKFDGTNWTWVSGSNLVDQSGVYGTKGTAASTNVPGARELGVSWIDSSDNLWLFGGFGFDSAGTGDQLNDLWKFDGTNWTWVSGGNLVNQNGVYGTQGTAAAANIPGSRQTGVSWIDSSDSLWLFGGLAYDSAGTNGSINDLWRYQP